MIISLSSIGTTNHAPVNIRGYSVLSDGDESPAAMLDACGRLASTWRCVISTGAGTTSNGLMEQFSVSIRNDTRNHVDSCAGVGVTPEVVPNIRFNIEYRIDDRREEIFGNPLSFDCSKALKIVQKARVAAIERGAVPSLKLLLLEIELAFAARNVELVDQVLRQLDPSFVPQVVWVGVLRSTFRARGQLPAWRIFLARVAEKLALLGRSPVQSLPGLIATDDRNIFPIGPTLF